MKPSPLQQVKTAFGDKRKLVAQVKKLGTKGLWLDEVNDVKGLGRVSNAKLLALHAALERAKAEFGSRDKLVEAILDLEKRSKDSGYRARIGRYPLRRLLDLHGAANRRAKRVESAAASRKRKRVTRSKKAKTKTRAS